MRLSVPQLDAVCTYEGFCKSRFAIVASWFIKSCFEFEGFLFVSQPVASVPDTFVEETRIQATDQEAPKWRVALQGMEAFSSRMKR